MERFEDLTTWLFWKKLLIAFVIGFLPAFVYGLIDVLGQFSSGSSDYHVLGTLLVSLVLGATTAGLRGVIALFTDWLPTDAFHGFSKGDKPTEIVVSRTGTVAKEPPADITVEPEGPTEEIPTEPEPVPEPEPEPDLKPVPPTPSPEAPATKKPSRRESRRRKRKSGS